MNNYIIIIILFILLIVASLLLVIFNCKLAAKYNINKVGGGIILTKGNLVEQGCTIPDGILTISENISEITGRIFIRNTVITQIDFLPRTGSINKLKIGQSAFESCTNLTKLAIPSFINIIENKAFKNCANLKKLIIYPHNELDTLCGTFFDDAYDSDSAYDISKKGSEAIFAGCPIAYLVIPEDISTNNTMLLRLFGTTDLTYIPTIQITNGISDYEHLVYEDTAVKDTAVKDTAVKDTAVKDTDVKDTTVKAYIPIGAFSILDETIGNWTVTTKVKSKLDELIARANIADSELRTMVSAIIPHMTSPMYSEEFYRLRPQLQRHIEVILSEFINHHDVWCVPKKISIAKIIEIAIGLQATTIIEVGAGSGLISALIKKYMDENSITSIRQHVSDNFSEKIKVSPYFIPIERMNAVGAIDYCYNNNFCENNIIFIVWSRARDYSLDVLNYLQHKTTYTILICAYTTGEESALFNYNELTLEDIQDSIYTGKAIDQCEPKNFYEKLIEYKYEKIIFPKDKSVYFYYFDDETIRQNNDHLEIFYRPPIIEN